MATHRWLDEDDKLPRYAVQSSAASLRDRRDEQNSAAGGETARRVVTDSGAVALGRIKLNRRDKTRRTYAFLVWKDKKARRDLLLCEVTSGRYLENLRSAWKVVHEHHLLTPSGRAGWPATRRALRERRRE